ncbi:unnamed protein product [Cunninghamella echinulata]
MGKLSTTEINKLLEDLNLNFEVVDKCLYVHLIIGFGWDWELTGKKKTEWEPLKAVVKRGLVEYYYANFTEVMLWYYYYTCKRHHIEHFHYKGPERTLLHANYAYFARIPKHYRNISPSKGLSIVKEAMVFFITHYNSIPPDYDEEYFHNNICKIID